VEKYQEAKFGAGNIQNSMNIVHMSADVHDIISAIYGSKRPLLTNGGDITVRKWLSGQSFQNQYQFGIKIMHMVTQDGYR